MEEDKQEDKGQGHEKKGQENQAMEMTEMEKEGMKEELVKDEDMEKKKSTENLSHTEASSLILERRDENAKRTKKYHTSALLLSWFSVLFSLGTGIAAIVLGIQGRSEAIFAYGMDAVLDSLSSVAVVWRFHGTADTVYMMNRERIACIAIGGLFIVSATSLITKSIVAIADRLHEKKAIRLFETFSLACALISVLIAAGKIYLGHKLNSSALMNDSIITLVGAAACFASVAGLQLYVHDTNLWYMDSVFGMALGLVLLGFGARLLVKYCREELKD